MPLVVYIVRHVPDNDWRPDALVLTTGHKPSDGRHPIFHLQKAGVNSSFINMSTKCLATAVDWGAPGHG